MTSDLFSETPSGRLRCALLILALGSLLYLTNLGGWDLWPADEPRFGQIEREMIKSGDWLVPHVNNEVYTDKPPLFFWTGAAFALLNGGQVESWTTRLPSALSGIGVLLITFLLGDRLFGRRAGFLGTLVLAASMKFVDQSRTAQTDMIMTVFAVWAMAVFAKAWFGSMKPLPAAIAFGALTGLATLGKGPVGVIVPIGSIALFVILAREWRRARWGAAAVALAVCVVVVFAWLGPMLLAISESKGQNLLVEQNVTRYLEPEHHLQPPWFFVETLPVDFLPMTLFLPALALVLWREFRGTTPMKRERLFLFSWIAFTFVFFSISPGKREQYILPLYPALSLLVGDWLDRRTRENAGAGRAFLVITRVSAILLLLAGPFVLFAAKPFLQAISGRIEGSPIPPEWFSFPAIGAGISLAGLAVWVGTYKKRLTGVLYGMVAASAILWLTVVLAVFPPLNERKSTRRFCEALNREWSPGETVYSYKLYRSEYHLFGDYYLTEVENFAPVIDAFKGPGRVFCLMRSEKPWEEFKKKIQDTPYSVLWNDAIGHRGIVLVSNRPGGATINGTGGITAAVRE